MPGLAARLVGLALAAGIGAAGGAPAAASPSARVDPIAAFVAGDCNLCHAVPGVEPAPRTTSCTGCHVWIREVAASPAKRAKALEVFPQWERYERNVATYLEVPSLDAAMARLDPAWVRGFLADPHDLRPHLPETMPRTALTPAQIDAIVGAFADARASVPAAPPPDRSRLARGEALFTAKGCAACHTFGGRHVDARVPLAPDLAHARAHVAGPPRGVDPRSPSGLRGRDDAVAPAV